jgi:hypothetical protein
MGAAFPEPEWFLALGRLMRSEGELFGRLGYAETRFAVRVIADNGEDPARDRIVGLVIDGYALTDARALSGSRELAAFDPDFAICAPCGVWQRMLDEIARNGRPELRHTLSSLALVGEEMWLESSDQLREDKFYRYNQTLQEMLNLAGRTARGD